MRPSQRQRAEHDPRLGRDQDAEQEPEPGPDRDDLAAQVRPVGPILDLLEQIRARLGPDEKSNATVMPVVPQDGTQLVGAGDDFSFELEGLPNVGGLVMDIPENVEATIRRDGSPLVGVADGQGRSGTLEPPGSTVADWSSVAIEGTNNASVAQDLGLWVAVIYER